MMKLKTENIELLEKLSLGETTKREEKIIRMEDELAFVSRELEKYKTNF
jgi:hypothetical protein